MLELRNICYEVEDNKEILKDISLTIDDHFVAITGPNGGGKSTLAKMIAGIITANQRTRSYWMERILRILIHYIPCQTWHQLMHFSSQSILKDLQ